MKNDKIFLVRQKQIFEKWRKAWDDLAAKQSWTTAFHSSKWIISCLENPELDMILVLIIRNEKLVCGLAIASHFIDSPALLFPTQIVSLEPRISTVRPASLIGLLDKNEKNVPIKIALKKSLAKISWQVGFFQYYVEREKWLTEAIQQIAREKKWKMEPGFSAPEAFMNFSKGHKNFQAQLSSKLKRSLNTSYNHLKRMEVYDFRELTVEKLSWQKIKNEMVSVFKRSWQAKSKHSPFSNKSRDLILHTAKRFFEDREFRAFFLYIHDVPIAFDAYFVHRKTLYPIIRGYDKKFRHLSPGNLLFSEAVTYFSEHGFTGIYLGPIRAEDSTTYKNRWANETWKIPNLKLIRPISRYGLIYQLYNSSKISQKIWWKISKLRQ